MPAKPVAPTRQEWCLPSECDDCRLLANAQRTMRLLRSDLSRRKSPARSSNNFSASSKASSFVSVQSISTRDLDPSDDTSTMSSAAASPVSRPRSSSNPNKNPITPATGPYCMRRPTLKELLQDTAPAPWNLNNFVEYASNNLCLENIEFVQDATRYRDMYHELGTDPNGDDARSMSSGEQEQLKERWTRIIFLYIAPSSPREVNLVGDIRSALAKVSVADAPPHPRHLQPAISKIVELIEDSILLGFFNEYASMATSEETAGQSTSGPPYSKRRASPALDHVIPASLSAPPPSTNASRSKRHSGVAQFSTLSTAFGKAAGAKSSVHGNVASPAARRSAAESVYASYTEFTDDLSAFPTPTSIVGPAAIRPASRTPPSTPPASTYGEGQGWRPSMANKSSNDSWKKMTKLFRKKSGASIKTARGGHSSIREE